MAEISLTGDQLLQLMELVAFEDPMTTAQLAVSAGINRTVAHRLLNTLHQRGYILRQGKVFTLGPIWSQMVALEEQNSVPRQARDNMRTLADEIGESVVMHRMDGHDALVVEQAISDAELVRVQHREGARHSLALGASGRAILAWQSNKVIETILTKLGNLETMRQKLDEIRQLGYSVSQNELQLGVCGAAVPLRENAGIVRYSLAVLVPTQREAKLASLIPALLKTQNEIEMKLQVSGQSR